MQRSTTAATTPEDRTLSVKLKTQNLLRSTNTSPLFPLLFTALHIDTHIAGDAVRTEPDQSPTVRAIKILCASKLSEPGKSTERKRSLTYGSTAAHDQWSLSTQDLNVHLDLMQKMKSKQGKRKPNLREHRCAWPMEPVNTGLESASRHDAKEEKQTR